MLIIASIGITTALESDVRKIILAGADILRHNFSYYSIEKNIEYIANIQKVIDDINAPTKHLIDFPINKIRLGDFDTKVFSVKENEIHTMKSGNYSSDCNQFIPIDLPNLGENVYKNQTITLGDGEVAIQVEEIINKDEIKIKVLNNGLIKYMKSFNIDYPTDVKKTIEQYTRILTACSLVKPRYIAYSYISEQINEKIKQIKYLENKPDWQKVIIKIENQHGIDDLEKICQDDFYSMILIDRGELGVNIAYEKVGIYQKEIVRIAKKYNKPVIVSTQILESAINNYIPTRSDILNLTTMILDGVHGIMLGQETVLGGRPAYPIYTAKKIILAAREYKKIRENNYGL